MAVHIVFILIAVMTILLRIAKYYILHNREQLKKKDKPCICYQPNELVGIRECTSTDYQGYYEKNGYSCKGCEGKRVKIDNVELEAEIIAKHKWESVVVTVANASEKFILPYLPFLYTLLCALYGN